MYKVMVKDMPVNMPYATGVPMSCMAKWFFNTLPTKPKLIPCDRYIAGMGGKILRTCRQVICQSANRKKGTLRQGSGHRKPKV